MKIFVASLEHETNTFSPLPTNMESYQNMVLFRPSEGGVASGYDRCMDFVALAKEKGHLVVRSLVAVAQPAGLTTRHAYESLRDEILDDLKTAGKVDMVFLVLHGAQMAEGYDDCEGDLISRARNIVGDAVPIGVQFDCHGNVTRKMVDQATIMIGCKEYPHVDYADRARELFDLIEANAQEEIIPTTALFRVPMLDIFHTTQEPVKSFVQKICEMENQDGVLSISLVHGFPWADMSETGAAVLVITDNNKDLAARLAEQVGQEFFSFKGKGHDPKLPINLALDQALAAGKGPVVIADCSDNPGGGAPGDSTFFLRAMLERGITDAALAMIWDPIAVHIAAAAGVGAELDLRIGGKTGPTSGDPLDVFARVTAVDDIAAQTGLGGTPEPLGPSVAIKVEGIHIVLNSIRQQTFSPDCFTELGIDPGSMQILVVKSNHHFHAQFAPMAGQVLYTDAPGAMCNNLNNLDYKKLQRPIWPLDDDVTI